MKFLVDAQLPSGVCAGLAKRGHNGVYVPDVLGPTASDEAIVAYALAHALVLITKDEDFARKDRRSDVAVVWLRGGNSSNRMLADWLEPRWDAVVDLLELGEKLVEVR